MKRKEKKSQQSAVNSRQLPVGKELKQANFKKEKRKMPLRHKNIKIHKEQTLNILYLVSFLSLRLPRKEERLYRGAFVAIMTFRSGLNQ